VRFPQAANARYLVDALGSRAVLGELWGSAERSVVFALPAGRYLVQRNSGEGSAGLELSLSSGESPALRADEFRAVPEQQLAARAGLLFPVMNGGPAELWTARAGVGTGMQF
jgi:hypothetical protein